MLALIKSQVHFPVAGDADEAENAMRKLRDAASALDEPQCGELGKILHDANAQTLLKCVFSSSPYLSKLAVRHADFLPELFSGDPANITTNLVAEVNAAEFEDVEKVKKHLRIAKGKVALCIALADLSGVWDLAWVTGALSSFADSAVKAAVNFLLMKAAREGQVKIESRYDPAGKTGLIILGMGKLGALELNYSSDIDLIVFFDSNRALASGIEDPQKFFIKLARDLVSILSDRTEDGYVFRTDLRLRPDPSSTPVAVSTQGALTYYETVGQNWERAAMIKARQIAGDKAAGEEFLKYLVPYVWRKNLDFAAIRDIHSIKRQMDARLDADKGSLLGYNVKLGSGGIREIEFFVQTQQLIWGGKQPQLRVRATCDALAALADLGHINAETRDALASNYRELRRIEHRLQMINDEQTHSLPETLDGMKKVAAFSGCKTEKEFEEALRKIISETHGKYTHIFKEEKTLAEGGNLIFTGVENDPSTLETLRRMGFGNPEYVSSSIRAWHHGSRRATRTKKARELITELTPSLLKQFSNLKDPDSAFKSFDDLIASLPAVSQVFSLFTSNPQLLELIVNIFGNSPYLTELLRRRPARVDAMLYPHFFGNALSEEETNDELFALISVANSYEEKMDVVKRYTQEKQLQVGVQLLKGLIDPESARSQLSIIADCALKLITDTVSAEFRETYGSIDGGYFAIIGFGKLGGRELSFDSDLDVVFVYGGSEDEKSSGGSKSFQPNVYYMRLAQRVMGAVSGMSEEGMLYEVDARLRPHGNKGPIATSEEGFAKYYEMDAWPVELLALTRARIVYADGVGRQRLEQTLKHIITKGLKKDELATQVKELRRRIAEQHPVKSLMHVKYAKGGLLDAELIVQYLGVCSESGDLPVGTIPQAQWLTARGVLEKQEGETLIESIKLFRAFQILCQLTGGEGGEVSPFTLSALNLSGMEGLEERLNIAMENTYKLFIRIFG